METILIIYLIGIVFTFGYWVGSQSYIEIRWWHAFIWVVIFIILIRLFILKKWEAFYRNRSVKLARVLFFNHKIRASEEYTNEYYNKLISGRFLFKKLRIKAIKKLAEYNKIVLKELEREGMAKKIINEFKK